MTVKSDQKAAKITVKTAKKRLLKDAQKKDKSKLKNAQVGGGAKPSQGGAKNFQTLLAGYSTKIISFVPSALLDGFLYPHLCIIYYIYIYIYIILYNM